MILVDTGPLVAAANRKDADHDASVKALADAHAPRLVPGVVIAEVAYSWRVTPARRSRRPFYAPSAPGSLQSSIRRSLIWIERQIWWSSTRICRWARPTPASWQSPSASASRSSSRWITGTSASCDHTTCRR